MHGRETYLNNEDKNGLIKKVKNVKSAEELLALAKTNGIELTCEEAEELFNSLGNELSDAALDGVSGGGLFGRALLELSKTYKMLKDDENLPETSDGQDNKPTLKFL